MTTDMSNGGEDLLLMWSSKVEELVDEDKTEEAINVLNDVIAKLEILDDAHTNLTLAAACDDIGRLYTKSGFSDKADSFFTKAFLIKQKAQQQQSGNFRNEISLTSRTPTNEEIESPKGITISEASTSLEEDWEAIADQSLMQSSSSQVTMEISKLSLENQSQTPKQHGRGAFTYGQRALYSDETNEITNKESTVNQSLDGFAEQLHTREELKYGTRHVLVVCGFSPKIPTRELENLFEAYTNHGVVIRRVNDTVALAVFRNPASAREALKSIHSQYNIRALDDDDSLLNSLSAKDEVHMDSFNRSSCFVDLEPPIPRPKTSAKTAQRIIMGALQSQGLVQKSHIKSSYSDIKKQEEERRTRILMRQKLRDEAWGPDD